MTLNGKCSHLLPRHKHRCQPAITLCVAGSKEGVMLCPECYPIIKKGGSIEIILTSRRNKRYRVFRARETASEPMWFELRTEWIGSE